MSSVLDRPGLMSRASHASLQLGLRLVRTIRGLLLLIIPVGLWQLLGSRESFSFPTPETWFDALGKMNSSGLLWPAAYRTLQTFFISLVVALIVGVLIGIVIGASPRLDRAFTPMLDFLRATPGVALVPALGLILGPGLISGVVIVVLAIVWPILLNTVIGMRSIPVVTREMSRALGLTRWERLMKVVIPSLAPQVMMGLRISVSLSLIVTLVTDIIGTGTGLGRLLIDRQLMYDSPAVWGLMLVIGIFGYLANVAFGIFERYVFARWPEDARPLG